MAPLCTFEQREPEPLRRLMETMPRSLARNIPVSRSSRLPHGFCLTKPNGDHPISAVCEVWSHPDGWELRMMIEGHGLLLATVEASVPRMLARVEKWRTAMLEKGWTG
jgi:hypothetical protein